MFDQKIEQEEVNDADWKLTKKEWDEQKTALAELQDGFKTFQAEVRKDIDELRKDQSDLRKEFEEFKVIVQKQIDDGRADLLKAFEQFKVDIQKQIDDRFKELLAEIKLIGQSQSIQIGKMTNMEIHMLAMGREIISINKFIHKPKHYEWNQQHKSNKERKFFKKVKQQHYIYTDAPVTPENQIQLPPAEPSPLISESSQPISPPGQ